MKKIFTLTALSLLFSLSVDAQWRKTWDFSKGFSAETKANLTADTENWTSNRTDANTGETTGWKDKKKMYGTLMANGVEIAELKGLDFLNKGLKGGDYLIDPATIRLSRVSMGFNLPKLASGQKVTVKAKSANGTDMTRGFTWSDNLDYIDGPANGICPGPDGLQTLVWQVKDGFEDSVTVTLSIVGGGVDIESIIIDDGDAPAVEEAKNVAYVTRPATLDEDMAYIMVGSAADRVMLTAIDAAENITLDSLQTYDAVIVSPYVEATDAIVPTLKSAVAYEPMVNLNVNLNQAWGYGTPTATSETTLTVAEEELESTLFEGLDVAAGLELLTDGTITGVTPGDYFAGDKVIAKAGEVVAIHQHNASRNSYILIPFTAENIASVNTDNVSIITNAAVMVARTKKDIVAAGAPVITKENKDRATVVTITTTNKESVIYYTTDGTEPTTASPVYAEPFTLTEACTVSAMATLDGYTQSKVATLDVDIKAQAAKPVISIEKNADNSVVTITSPTENTTIYYSYNMEKDAAKAQKYTEPIVLRDEPTFIYAFAAGDDCVQSELAGDYVAINSLNAQTIRIDTLAHFDANQDDWFVNDAEAGGTGEAKAYYFWGKSAWNYYSDEVDHEETVKGSEGQDSIVYIYKPDPNAVKIVNPLTENGWILKSAGQVLTGELTSGGEAAVGNGATGYFAETAEDMIGGIPTKGKITFGGKANNNPYTASIETTGKYAAPFDVVVYVTNGGTGEPNLEIQVSADGEKWDSIGTLKMATTQRYYKKTRVSYETAGEYYVRVAQVSGSSKAQVYDIYILNNGEESKKYDAETVGIDGVNAASAVAYDEIFSVNGVRQNSLRKGLNIVRKHLADGTVKTVKVMVK